MAESKKEKILEYKGKPLVRCGKTIYYGSMSEAYVVCLNILSDEDIKGLKPYQIVEYKALCGDTSDNIPGVKGVGEKAVIPLLQEYGNIESIYDTIENLSSKEEKELKKFFKESLGIGRSPISYAC